MTDTMTPADPPLWSDEAIITRYRVAFDRNPDVHHFALMAWMRDEMQDEIARLQSELARLSDTLAFAAQYRGIEARPCPLCVYEDGVFVKRCQMHEDMEAQRVQLIGLQSELAAAQKWQPVEDGEYEWSASMRGNVVVGENEVLVYDTTYMFDPCTARIVLPADIRLCRKVTEANDVDQPNR